MAGDGIRFGDLNGDGVDDYLFIDLDGGMTAYLNGGPQSEAIHGWLWIAQNHSNPIALE